MVVCIDVVSRAHQQTAKSGYAEGSALSHPATEAGYEEPSCLCYLTLPALISQGLEAGEAEATAAIKAVQAEKAELEGRLSALEDKIEALETENANLESMKV